MSKQTDLINVTDAITVDGSNNVGIGTGSPSANLDVASSNATIHLTDTDDTTYAEVRNNGGTFTIASDEGQNATNSSINFRVDASERMRIDSAGRVTMPYQPAFVAYDPSGNARSSSGLFSDEFTETLTNTGNHYNTSTGYFTAPVAGYYVFGWNLFTTVSGTTTSRAGIWHNGSVNGYGFSSGSTVAGTAQGSILIYMSANDTAALGTQSASYSAYWYANQTHCRFWGYLVG